MLMYFNFSKWIKWENRDELDQLKYPGVYAIAYSDEDLANQEFDWLEQIIYIGMTKAQKLKSRLKQFDNTIIGKKGHGGVDRVRYEYSDYKRINKMALCVSAIS